MAKTGSRNPRIRDAGIAVASYAANLRADCGSLSLLDETAVRTGRGHSGDVVCSYAAGSNNADTRTALTGAMLYFRSLNTLSTAARVGLPVRRAARCARVDKNVPRL